MKKKKSYRIQRGKKNLDATAKVSCSESQRYSFECSSMIRDFIRRLYTI
jgi:hypothetical protein